MLEKKFAPAKISKADWGLSCPYSEDWSTSKTRVLVVLQTVDGRDIKAGGVLESPEVRRAFVNVLKCSRKLANQYGKIDEYSLSVVNFNAYKHLHLSAAARKRAETEFRARTIGLIKKMDPTHILFAGDLSLLYPVANAGYKNGWVHEIEGRKVVSTLDFCRLLENNGELANLLGFVIRHTTNLFLGELPHSLAEVRAKPVYIDTIEKFDKVIALFGKAEVAGVDTETKNLSVNHNAIYTIQLCFDGRRGYVIPIDHPNKNNPFSVEQRQYIKMGLRKCFGQRDGPLLITMNGMFDLTVIRNALNLETIYLKVWEVTAGEHLLDENISGLSSLGLKSGGLAAIYCAYGNDHYYTAAFSKAERSTTGSIDPATPDFLLYAATDAVSVVNIRLKQIERAGKQKIDGKVYTDYFNKHMLYQMSDTVHHLSHLQDSGSLIDLGYLRGLMKPQSVLVEEITRLGEEFKDFPEIQRANDDLLEEAGFKNGSLFGKKRWIFDFGKPAHRSKLFFDVMGMKSVSKTSKGNPSIDKAFIDYYRDRNFLVQKYGEFQEATKLKSTYVKGWLKKMTSNIDSAKDSFLRAGYKFFNVDTGRLASADPNLQNIPARGRLAHIIKRMFVTMDGHLLIRFDYSAHEVRFWAIISKDDVLANAFKTGQALRKQWIKNPTDGIKAELKKKGDMHIYNAKLFFDRWIEKSDPLRDAIKAVIFGVIYGKGNITLANDIKRPELSAIKTEMNAARNAKDTKRLAELVEKFKSVTEDDREEYAASLVKKLFSTFKKGHKWLKKMEKMATEEYQVLSPIGRIRHLYASSTLDKRIVSKQVRRGVNAPIQGMASEVAVKAGRLTFLNFLKARKHLYGKESTSRLRSNRVVHDASYFTVPYDMVIPFIHVLQWCSTYGIAASYAKEFGVVFNVEPEIELEIATMDTNSKKWDWSLPNLKAILDQVVEDGCKTGLLSGNKEEILAKIWEPWKNKESRKWLDKNYPLLGVSLYEEIGELCKQQG